MILSKDQVMAFLPHRDPFLFVDTIEKLETLETVKNKKILEYKDLVGSKVTATFNVTNEMTILKGHFPNEPIVPGVVQCEMMAQASAFIFLPIVEFDPSKYSIDTKLIGIDKARYRKQIVPGMNIKICSTLTRVRGKFNYYQCEIFHNEDLCADGIIFAKINIEEIKD